MSAFNGSLPNAFNTPRPVRRARAEESQMTTAPAPKPMMPNQAQLAQPVQVQQQPAQQMPGMFRADGTANYSQIALRDNMARNVQMNTLAAANPATASLPHVQAAIAARNQKNEGLAEMAGRGPNYFQNRDLANSANTRQDAMVGAQTDQMAADTNRVNTMLPGQVENQRQVNTGLNLANQGQSLKNFYMPGQFEGQQAAQQAATEETKAKTRGIDVETGQVAQGADQYKAAATRYQKENDDLRKQLDELRTKLAGDGIDPGTTNAAPQGGKPQQQGQGQQPQAQQFQVGQQRRHKATGRIETFNGKDWVAN